MSSTRPNLTSLKDDGPRLAMFFSDEGNIASAFILADQTVRVKIDPYDFLKTFATLIGAYHAWNVGYPRGYKNILEIVDEYVFSMSPAKPNVSYYKFKKAFKEFQESKAAQVV